MVVTKATKRKNILILVAFFLILILPFASAWLLFFKGNPHTLATSNHGELISPLRNTANIKFYDLAQKTRFSTETLHGKWWLVYVSPEKCQQTCHNTLYNMRQIHTALGKDSSRVGKLFIAHHQCLKSVCEEFLSENYPDLRKVRLDEQDFAALFNTVGNQSERELVGELYLLDPQGNFMMHYSVENPAKEILQDLKRLLKVSNVG